MLKTVFAACMLATLCALSFASSETGQFLPRAYFTLDAQGHASHAQPVNAHLLRRLRRQVFSQSSSSSSSYSSNGQGQGQYTSSSQQTVSNNGYGTSTSHQTVGSSGYVPSTGVNLSNRFSDSSSGSNYGSGSSYSSVPVGQVLHTTNVVDPSGKVTTTQTHGVVQSDGKVNYSTTQYKTPKN